MDVFSCLVRHLYFCYNHCKRSIALAPLTQTSVKSEKTEHSLLRSRFPVLHVNTNCFWAATPPRSFVTHFVSGMALLPTRRAHVDTTRLTADHRVLREVFPEESCAVNCPYRSRVGLYPTMISINHGTVAVEGAIVSARLLMPRMADRHARHASTQVFHSTRSAKDVVSTDINCSCHCRPALASFCKDWRLIAGHGVPQITVAASGTVSTRAHAVTVAKTREIVARMAKTGAPLANNLVGTHFPARRALVVLERHRRISEGGSGADWTRRISRS